MFSGGIERDQWHEMVKEYLFSRSTPDKCFCILKAKGKKAAIKKKNFYEN